ncbi:MULTISPECIES: anthranilate synthase component II [Paenibacillus]|uniref:Glutamine amidotransferase n=1 Tax=Paenibacillus aceti TaxID=1820010 RepID=A0ABQ1W924_9BACL|nr:MULTISPECIES: aminodeoxychorismate/anthranilate synthase component II [Paenibacillus]GGG18117.1 glutamine amidotransferase [Paenibacillus aceti]
MFILIDNNDSFTFNLYQYFLRFGVDITVINIEDIDNLNISEINPAGVIISPGPGHPKDLPKLIQFIKDIMCEQIPILGVCLGFQAIGYAYNGSTIEGVEPVHGKVSLITHDGKDIFEKVPSPIKVTRYHSLVLDESKVPSELLITATTSEGTIMGIRHITQPTFGVQFHPEAELTEFGMELVGNFVRLCGELSKNN